MLKLKRIFKNCEETGSFSEQVNLYPLAVNNGNGDECIKDTHHPIRHRSRHPAGDAKLLGA